MQKNYPSGDIYYNQELKQQRCPTPLFYTMLCLKKGFNKALKNIFVRQK